MEGRRKCRQAHLLVSGLGQGSPAGAPGVPCWGARDLVRQGSEAQP